MDFDFTPDTLMLRDMLRRFIQKDVRPLEMKYFTAGGLEPDESARLRRAIEQMGLWGVTVPEEHGGGGLDLVTTCLLEIELGNSFVPLEIGEVPNLLYACSGDQVSRYLEPALAGERRAILALREPGAVHPQSWSLRAEPGNDGGQEGYLLNGQKLVGSRPHPEDFFLVVASSPQGFTAFIAEPVEGRLTCQAGKREAGELTLLFKNYPAHKEALLGQPGQALQLVVPTASRVRIQTGARYVGIVERLLEMAVEHAKDWLSFGAPISLRPAVQRMLAETQAELESARWLVYKAAWLVDLGREELARRAAAYVRLITGRLLQAAVERVTLIFAGPGSAEQIEPGRLVYSTISPAGLELALEKTLAEIASELLDLRPNP